MDGWVAQLQEDGLLDELPCATAAHPLFPHDENDNGPRNGLVNEPDNEPECRCDVAEPQPENPVVVGCVPDEVAATLDINLPAAGGRSHETASDATAEHEILPAVGGTSVRAAPEHGNQSASLLAVMDKPPNCIIEPPACHLSLGRGLGVHERKRPPESELEQPPGSRPRSSQPPATFVLYDDVDEVHSWRSDPSDTYNDDDPVRAELAEQLYQLRSEIFEVGLVHACEMRQQMKRYDEKTWP
jgi:hypothetical protein